VLCVCSDQTVGAKGHDEAIHSVADLAFPVTSDAEEVKRFLSGAGNRVVIRVPGHKFYGIGVDDPTIAQWIANRELAALKSESRAATKRFM